MATPIDNRRGIIATLVCTALFMISDVAIKLAAAELPPSQIVAPRGLMCLAMFLALAAMRGQLGHLASIRRWPVLQRGLIEAGVALCFVTALAQLQIANVTSIMQASPLILTLLLVVLGLEVVGWRRWLSVIVGLVGVLLIVKPDTSGFGAASLIALAGAVFIALRDIHTRRIPSDISTFTITFGTVAIVTTAALVLGLFETWRQPTTEQWGLLFLSALVMVVGGQLQVSAARNVDLSVVMPYRYSVILWSLVAGYVVWGDVPDWIALVGSALIVGSGIYTLHREAVRRRMRTGGAP